MSGPTGCGKTNFVLKLVDHANELIEPVPAKFVYYLSLIHISEPTRQAENSYAVVVGGTDRQGSDSFFLSIFLD